MHVMALIKMLFLVALIQLFEATVKRLQDLNLEQAIKLINDHLLLLIVTYRLLHLIL